MTELDKLRVAANFGRAAKGYEKYAVLQKMVGERLLERLDLVKISPEIVVDVGSGTGATARALAQKYKRARTFQVDLSLPMLRESRLKSARFFSRQQYICADAEKMPLISNVAGLVFSSLTFQWCNNLDEVFTETKRMLMPGGLFLFATLGPDTLKELRASWAAVDDTTHVNTFFDMHDIGDALVRSGMSGVVMDTENITLTYPDCFGLMRDLKHVGALNAIVGRRKGLTGKRKMQSMAQVYEQYRRNNELPATYEIVYGHAWCPEKTEAANNGVAYISVENISRRRT